MANEQTADKKIIIDEDWKSQVQAEKEAAAHEPDDHAPPHQGQSAQDQSKQQRPEASPLPPPSLPFLLTTLGTQAMIFLGVVPHPLTGKPDFRPEQAKHFIDTLAMLEQKTEGNRTPEESALLRDLLHQLRMAYVTLSQQGQGADSQQTLADRQPEGGASSA